MKKTYITIITLLVLLVATVLTYISNTPPTPEPIIKMTVVESTSTTPVADNPEGEANPIVSKLDMKSWVWMQTTYPGGTAYVPKNPSKFILTFNKNNFSSRTDCNGIGGEFTVNEKSIKFDKMMSTLMYCEGSQESEYGKMLTEVVSYEFTNRGELFLNLKDDGVMLFK